MIKLCHVLIALVLLSSAAHGATQSLLTVQTAAEKFVTSQLRGGKTKHYVNALPLDNRLQLAACTSPLDAFQQSASANGARITVGVRCTSDNSWTIYVPVTVEVDATVLVLRRALARRARVSLTDVDVQTRRVPGWAAHFIEDATHLSGHRLRRSLPAGTVLTVDVLAPDILVRRGQHVTLIAAHGPIEIRAQGQALSEGAESERIRVQNVSSLKVVEGVVINDSLVRIP